MNREILFKAKLKDWKTNPQQNKWVEGYYVSMKETTHCFTEDYERNPVKTLHYIAVDTMTDWGLPNKVVCYEIDPDTLCQYTGLKDKNGKKIWENDIVNCYESECFGVIKWEEDEAKFIFDIVLEDLAFEPEDVYDYIDDMEVVGNIFDNPELLKGSEENG